MNKNLFAIVCLSATLVACEDKKEETQGSTSASTASAGGSQGQGGSTASSGGVPGTGGSTATAGGQAGQGGAGQGGDASTATAGGAGGK